MIYSLPPNRRILLVALLLLSSAALFAQKTIFRNGAHVGQIKVKVSSEASSSFSRLSSTSKGVATGIQAFDAVAKNNKATKMYRLFPYDEKNESKLRKHNLHLWYIVEIDENIDPHEAVKQFKSVKEVQHVEVEHEKILAPYNVTPYTPSASTQDALPFNDPMLKDQWHYHNTNQTGYGNADINLFEAWKKTSGASNIIVSVHDQGVDVNHKDLKANIWTNLAELNGQPNVDDDNNGYVDDIHGYNFANRSGAIDPQFHATHVAGTIAAVNNNGIGVSGIAGGNGSGNGVKIMSMEILGGGQIENSYIYAADNGAVISQNSWGYTSPYSYDQSVLDAIDYFVAEAGNYPGSPMKGGIVIFAAGNSNSNDQWYPGYYPNVLSVSSIGPEWKKADYSNFGDWVEVAAPGGDQDDYGSKNGVLSTIPTDSYAYMQGTSMACPHVSGIAALALANRTKQMTNAELWNKLVTGVVNIDQYNPDYVGMLGSGAIDASLAIKNDLGSAPVAITDLTITGVSQEFATVSWTVPMDADDGVPLSFQLYYHTQPITLANLASAKVFQIQNQKKAGDSYSFEIDGLLGLTTYYFAITSTDRWGNVSMLSNIPSATTNAGPSIAVDEDSQSIDLTIDAETSQTATHDITILNNGAGILRWDHLMRHKNSTLSFNASSLHYPTPSKSNGPTSIGRMTANDVVSNWKKTNVQAAATSFTPVEFEYTSYATNIIGETNTSLTNSALTKFNVSQPEGFNLTNVQMYLKHDPAKGPVIMEVYQGDQPTKDNLIYAQEYSNYSKDEMWAYITLNEQLYFESGTTFWVAFHVPAGNLYPLGIGYELDPAYSTYCYMSFDMGNKWSRLEDVLGSKDFAWSIVAASYNQFLGTYLTLNPSSGEVASSQNELTTLTADGSQLINGSYSANLILTSNDAKNRELRIPVNLTVSGHQPKIKHIDIADFGSVFVGTEKKMDLILDNQGFGNFNNPSFSIAGSQFQISGNTPWQIQARNQVVLTVKFTPTTTGNINDILTFTDGNQTYQIPLFGVGAATSKITITPATQTINSITIGDVVNANITVKNTGAYPLKYFVPGFDTKGVSDNWPSSYHKYGYKKRSNNSGDPSPITYSFQDISTSGTDITAVVKDEYSYFTLDMGFQFPYYGENMNTIYIARNGFTTFDNSVNPLNSPSLGNPYNPRGYISPLGSHFNYVSQGQIFYQVLADRVIVQYSNVWDGYDVGQSITAQMVLFSNGNIRFYYDNMGYSTELQQSLAILIEDMNQSDGILVSNYNQPANLYSGLALGFDYPGPNVITQIDNGSGIISPGSSSVVNVTMNTATLTEGLIARYINFISNDPANASKQALVQLNITAGGKAVAQLSTDTIAFGNVFQGAVKSSQFVLKNPGTAKLGVKSMKFIKNKFTLAGNQPTNILPGMYEKYTVTIPTNTLASLQDWLNISYNDGTYDTIYVSGNVIDAPAINVDLSPITQSLAYGDSVSIPFNIQNTGLGELEVVVTGDQWLTYQAPTGTSSSNIPNATYTFDKHNNGDFYQWIDIRKTGTHLPFATNFEKADYWRDVTLPFPFEFYGKAYTKLKVGDNGIISLDEDPDVLVFTDNIPTSYTDGTFIMPYWSFAGFNLMNYPKNDIGIFYQAYDDKVIITWSFLSDNFGMGDPISAQVFLYENGTMKFQYRMEGSNSCSSTFSAIGVQQNKTNAVAISDHQTLDHGNGLAFIVMPANKHIVSANSTLNGVIKINAQNIYGGVYSKSLKIKTNVPGSESLEKPVQLTVLGNAILDAADSVDFGNQMITYDQYGNPNTSYKDVHFSNTGSAPLQISWMQMSDGTQGLSLQVWALVDGWFGPEWQWADISGLYSPWAWTTPTFTVNPGDELKMRAAFAPTSSGNFSDNAVLTTTIGDVNIYLKGNAFNPPVLNIDSTAVAVNMNLTTDQNDQSIAFDNANGQSDLTYDLSIDYGRVTTTASSKEKMSTTANNLLKQIDGKISIKPVAAADATYNRTISYTSKEKPDTFVGTGGGAPAVIATQFNAGATGFNMSHVETWARTETVASITINVEVRAGGTSVADAVKIGQGSIVVNGTGSDNSGSFRQIALDKPALIYPNENFYVIVSYPLGLNYPQGAITDSETIDNRYLYNDEGTWYDLQTISGFQNIGWMMFAAEQTPASASWLTITSNQSGTVTSGNSSSIQLHFDGNIAQRGDQVAQVIMKTNDPVVPIVHIPVSLHLNDAPLFGNVPDQIVVAEHDTLTLKIKVSDPEGNIFTVNQIQTYQNVVYAFDGTILTVTITPSFGSAGNYVYSYVAKDEYNAERQLSLNVEITHTNRAPIYIAANKQISIDNDGRLNKFLLSDYFADPDGDNITYTLTSSSDSVEVFTSSSTFLLKSKSRSIGSTKLFFAVSDVHGAVVKDTLILNINVILTTEEAKVRGVSVYPNPVRNILNLKLSDEWRGIVLFQMVDVTGKQMFAFEKNVEKETIAIDATTINTGFYLLRLNSNGKQAVVKIIKE
ncbi:MAG: S8 family serine peptidase [Cyclobacteriaceae bacterium]